MNDDIHRPAVAYGLDALVSTASTLGSVAVRNGLQPFAFGDRKRSDGAASRLGLVVGEFVVRFKKFFQFAGVGVEYGLTHRLAEVAAAEVGLGSLIASVAASHAQRFFSVYDAAFENVLELDSHIRRYGRVRNVRPVETAAVLSGDQCRIYFDGFHSEGFGDGGLDVLAHGGVVLVEEVGDARFLPSADILAEQVPTDARVRGFTTVAGLGNRPVRAWGAADEEVETLVLGEVGLEHVSALFGLGIVRLGDLDGGLLDFVGDIAVYGDSSAVESDVAARYSVEEGKDFHVYSVLWLVSTLN